MFSNKTIFSARGYRGSEVMPKDLSKSSAVRVRVTTVLPRCPQRFGNREDILQRRCGKHRITFSGWPGSQGHAGCFMSCLVRFKFYCKTTATERVHTALYTSSTSSFFPRILRSAFWNATSFYKPRGGDLISFFHAPTQTVWLSVYVN